jgi:DNA-binding transcriptional regulator YdaS (Cro superfamily)
MDKAHTSPIQRACNAVGGQSCLAELLEVNPAFVNQWVKGRRKVPAAYCPAIETFSHGAATKQELRPDDWQKYWPELASQSNTQKLQAASEESNEELRRDIDLGYRQPADPKKVAQ